MGRPAELIEPCRVNVWMSGATYDALYLAARRSRVKVSTYMRRVLEREIQALNIDAAE